MKPETTEILSPGFFIFQRCSSCGVKLHIAALTCWKCSGKNDGNTYDAHNPDDLIYSLPVNDIDTCLDCRPTQNGKTCKKCFAFGFGKGQCDLCNRFEPVRFQCCQKAQRENNVDVKAFSQLNCQVKLDNSRHKEAV